jgi:hypothetical protein
MMSSRKPLKIVRTIPGPGTMIGPGDIHVDENGTHWRQMDDYETDAGSTATTISVTRKIHNGWLW